MMDWLHHEIAHSAAVRSAKEMLDAGRLPQTLIIEGQDPVHRMAFARYLAAGLVCTGADTPCGECNVCRLVAKDGYEDVISVVPEDKKSAISVDQIRRVRQDAYLAPGQGSRKVFIINGTMNPQAQNAFLKCLEEPPAGVYFMILCVHHGELLDTVVSRGSIFSLSGCGDSSQDTQRVAECVAACGKAIAEGRREAFLLAVSSVQEDRLLHPLVLSGLYQLLHRSLTVTVGQPSEDPVAQLLARRLTVQHLLTLTDTLAAWQQRLRYNPNAGLFFTALCAAIFPRR